MRCFKEFVLKFFDEGTRKEKNDRLSTEGCLSFTPSNSSWEDSVQNIKIP